MIALLLLVQVATLGVFPVPPIVRMTGESRTYHGVSIAQLKETKWTHVAACGRVEYVTRESDGDDHLRLALGGAFVIVEVVPYHRLPLPKVGQWVRVAGIHRYDRVHQWEEIHPAEAISIVESCTT